jgi:hypothetical protein
VIWVSAAVVGLYGLVVAAAATVRMARQWRRNHPRPISAAEQHRRRYLITGDAHDLELAAQAAVDEENNGS